MEKKFYCQDCGHLYCEQSEEYQNNFPIASIEDRERQLSEHWKECAGRREGIMFDPLTGNFVGDFKKLQRITRDALNKCRSQYALVEIAKTLLIL